MAEKNLLPKLVSQACQKIGLKMSFSSQNHMVMKLHLPTKNHYILNSNLGLVSSTEAQICVDKAYQIEVLKNLYLFPATKAYLDPANRFGHPVEFEDLSKITDDIGKNFDLPVIIKMNSGAEGQGVFLCMTKEDVTRAIEKIFSHQSWEYDHVLLAQEYIKPKAEYRAVFYQRNLEICYLKDNQNSKFVGNLSPLHFEGAKAILIEDQSLLTKITRFIRPIFSELDLKYAGFDIIADKEDNLHLIEINSAPGYSYFLQNNSPQKVIELFSKIFLDLKNETIVN